MRASHYTTPAQQAGASIRTEVSPFEEDNPFKSALLEDRENYDISTPGLKSPCSASELPVLS